MNVQSNINQMLSLSALLTSQSPRAKAVKEAREIQGKQEQAKRGIEDIEKNLRREELTESTSEAVSRIGPPTKKEYDELNELEKLGGPKKYNEEEYKNIQERAKQYQKDIYDAKSGALNPEYKGLIDPDLIKQPKLSSMLDNISNKTSGRLSQIQAAKDKAAEAAESRKKEQEKSEEFKKTIMRDVTPEYGVRERF